MPPSGAPSRSAPPTIRSAPVYNVGDTVYLDDRAHQITELREDTVQLLPTGMSYPIYRVESRERFEQLCGQTTATTSTPSSCPSTLTRRTRTCGTCWPTA
ncbi:MAG: hypothetical protein ACLU9S_01550 [Oscillospiraceae bacterium]